MDQRVLEAVEELPAQEAQIRVVVVVVETRLLLVQHREVLEEVDCLCYAIPILFLPQQ